VVEVAEQHGATGARMTGGGFGGAAIALLEAERVDELSDAVMAAFAGRGFRQPSAFPVVPAEGASRIG
jgi:galactokinase